MKSVYILKILIILKILTGCKCLGSLTSKGQLKCVLGLNSQSEDDCGSSHFVEFLDLGDAPNTSSSTLSAPSPEASPFSTFSSVQIYVHDAFDEDATSNGQVKFWDSHNFTWSLACHDDFERLKSYHMQTNGISINSLVMSGSLEDFLETFNMTSGGSGTGTMADLCEGLKTVRCKFIVRPVPSEKKN
jgi:hypothetical protein